MLAIDDIIVRNVIEETFSAIREMSRSIHVYTLNYYNLL